MKVFEIAPVKYIDNKMLVLDQTRLPGEEVYEEMRTKEDVWEAIYKLKVRGAPAIGVAAAYGLYLSVRESQAADIEEFAAQLKAAKDYLVTARPTAVNLAWALSRMWDKFQSEVHGAEAAIKGGADKIGEARAEAASDETTFKAAASEAAIKAGAEKIDKDAAGTAGLSVDRAKAVLFAEAEQIRKEDEAACFAMGEYGLSLLKPGMGILTHCNAGTIATAKYGTCLAPIYLGQERGYDFKVFADETRPLLQGARLTSWELCKSGIDVTLICDNMASIVMRNGWIDAVVVGCDRMAANGDGANKIGTSGVAILAKEYGIPFYMYVPTSTIDLDTPTGDDIQIELRDGEEIYKMWYERPMAPEGVKTYNPSFDVTPAKYITAVITEKGICRPPYDESLAALFK